MQQVRNRARGQALVLFLGFAAAMIGVMLIAFNSGQVSNAKMRAMNAADAAAYSGAVWQARSLNFQAYMNRAMVANEVAIAQSVSLRSWTSYVKTFANNAAKVTSWIPYVGAALRAVAKIVDGVNTVVQRGLPIAEDVMRGVSVLEHTLQEDMFLAGSAVFDLAGEVAKSNGAEISSAGKVMLAYNAAEYWTFTDTYGPGNGPTSGDGRARLREVTLNSRDGFSRKRDWMIGSESILGIRKQGGTDLVDYDWVGLDSACLYFLKGCQIPLGWGGAQAYAPNRTVRTGTHGDYNEWNERDGVLAKGEATKNAKKMRAGAFPGYRDLHVLDKAPKQLPLAIEVMIKGTGIPSANSVSNAKVSLTDGTSLEHDPHFLDRGAGVYAVAEACVTFERPHAWPRAGGVTEYASLFSPYWRASLATEGAGTRALADLVKALPPIDVLTKGKGSCHS